MEWAKWAKVVKWLKDNAWTGYLSFDKEHSTHWVTVIPSLFLPGWPNVSVCLKYKMPNKILQILFLGFWWECKFWVYFGPLPGPKPLQTLVYIQTSIQCPTEWLTELGSNINHNRKHNLNMFPKSMSYSKWFLFSSLLCTALADTAHNRYSSGGRKKQPTLHFIHFTLPANLLHINASNIIQQIHMF